jgi:hypothetical protein
VPRIALVLSKDWLGSGLRLLCVLDRRLTPNDWPGLNCFTRRIQSVTNVYNQFIEHTRIEDASPSLKICHVGLSKGQSHEKFGELRV